MVTGFWGSAMFMRRWLSAGRSRNEPARDSITLPSIVDFLFDAVVEEVKIVRSEAMNGLTRNEYSFARF